MPSRHSIQVGLDVDPSVVRGPATERSAAAVRVLFLGDFGGRGVGGPADRGPARPIEVDRDNLDAVMMALKPVVRFADGSVCEPAELDDLHPDVLLDRIGSVAAALDGREAAGGATEGLLDRIVDRVAGPERPRDDAGDARRRFDSVRAFAAEAAERDRVPAPDPDSVAREKRSEAAAARRLREVLADPAMRSIERLWRGLDFIVRRVETGPRVRIYLADLPRAVVDHEVAEGRGIRDSALNALLAAGAGPDHEGWTWVVLDGRFGPDPDDLTTLAWTTGLCAAHGATLLVDGTPALAGIPDLDALTDPETWTAPDPGWEAFRAQPEAGHLAVALPGFLLRAPYGADTDPVAGLPFEEITRRPVRGDYVWGGGALACATVLAREAALDRPDSVGLPDTTLAGLPLHSWRNGVDAGTTCGAAAMTDAAVRRLVDTGLVPVAWARGADSVRVLLPRTAAGMSLLE